ncbi:MAG TPA: hypothetical protein VNE86_05415 [Nitrososphaerales archaeon]|nr:hypothetical protein [Nitrososphaerales archaeon]
MSEDDWNLDDWKKDSLEPPEIMQFDKPQPKIVDKKDSTDVPSFKVESKPEPFSVNNQILLGIDNGLDAFGKNVKEIFYAQMETSRQFKRSQILDNIEQFQLMIEQFFKEGSPFVERSVGREILLMFDIAPPSGVNFKTAVEIVKRHPRQKSF